MRSYFTLDLGDAKNKEVANNIMNLNINWEEGKEDWIIKTGKFDGVAITVYKKGKILLQGKNIDEVLKTVGYKDEAIEINVIGVDESGKGDYFGPLVTAAVSINSQTDLLNLEIRDSKEMNDDIIKELAEKIESQCEVAVSILLPKDYNEEYDKIKNLNTLLANEHVKNINKLLTDKSKKIYIDKFASKSGIKGKLLPTKAEVIEETKAESKYFSVACASIVARAHFVQSLEELSNDIGIQLPKGAYLVEDVGRNIIKKYGLEGLKYVAKMHFKTTDKLLTLF